MTDPAAASTDTYRHFDLAVYARVYEVREMADLDWLAPRFETISRYVKFNKIYLETHRDMIVADEKAVRRVRGFFTDRGIRAAGGITVTVNERNRFQTYCYTNSEHREKLKEVAAFTAGLFDEIILDDFFFTNCKCASCIAAKGSRSWTEMRLSLMGQAATELVLEPARAVNPGVKVVIKYPNWYEHFHGLGYDLQAGPRLFDGIYTGTETRDPIASGQHLQPYHGYAIVRYFENIAPGRNGGGWVDPGGIRDADRYAEQLWITLFAKARELTLFDFRLLLHPLKLSLRAPWQDRGDTSFKFDVMAAPLLQSDGTLAENATLAPVAGHALARVDSVLGELGQPLGTACYRPYHAMGEDFLPGHLGMLGIPLDLRPDFPDRAQTVLLTESSKHDPRIVELIKKQLTQGKTVVVTARLFKALQDKGIRDIVELEVTERTATVSDYRMGWFDTCHGEAAITIPHISYLTNDSWDLVSGESTTAGHPLLHDAAYGGGRLIVFAVPDDFDHLYRLPPEVLRRIREVLLGDLYIWIDAPAQVMLFVYDNDTFIVESFLPRPVTVTAVVVKEAQALRDIDSQEVISAESLQPPPGGKDAGTRRFPILLPPHSYRVLRLESNARQA